MYARRAVRVLIAFALALSMIAVSAPVGAAGHSVDVSGVGIGIDPKHKADIALELTGDDLKGRLDIYVESWDCESNGDGTVTYTEAGHEVFRGKLGKEHVPNHKPHRGRFGTTYTFEGVFAGECDSDGFPDFNMQWSGGCIHTVVWGTGAFKNVVEGAIVFTDRIPSPPGPAADFPFEGTLYFG